MCPVIILVPGPFPFFSPNLIIFHFSLLNCIHHLAYLEPWKPQRLRLEISRSTGAITRVTLGFTSLFRFCLTAGLTHQAQGWILG